jgi:transposase InsO family protein
VHLVDGTQPSIVTGIDDYSRFCVSAKVVARATAKPTCDALAEAMRTHGVPEAILTDNGKVFTSRFGANNADVLFDRICKDNGIRHLLTAPRSPTTTGKVERFHKTMKREFLDGKVFDSIEDAQHQLDGWVVDYNNHREHEFRDAAGAKAERRDVHVPARLFHQGGSPVSKNTPLRSWPTTAKIFRDSRPGLFGGYDLKLNASGPWASHSRVASVSQYSSA